MLLNKFLSQCLAAASNFLGLEATACENKFAKIALHTGENLARFLAFSDLGYNKDSCLSTSVIGALGLTAATALDDIAITYGLYQEHHLAKAGCAAYGSYKLVNNNQVEKFCNGASISDKTMKYGAISTALLAASYIWGSGDMIGIMRSNTEDSIEFANQVYKLSDEQVNVFNDIRVGIGTNAVIGGARQFLVDIDMEIGGPLNPLVTSTVSTIVNIAASRHSEDNFKNILVEKFCTNLENVDISKLDSRAKKILEELPEYINKASSSITKNATNTGVKTSYQYLLAGSKIEVAKGKIENDLGLSVFIMSNLFNSVKADNIYKKVADSLWNAQDDYEFNKLTNEGNIDSMRDRLCSLRDQKPESVSNAVLNCGRKLFNVITPILVDSALVGMMYNKDAALFSPSSYKSAYMTAGTILGIGETFVDIDAFAAVQELQYLYDALNNQTE